MQLIIDARKKKKKKKKGRSFYLSTYIFQPPLSNFSLHEYIHGVVSRNIFSPFLSHETTALKHRVVEREEEGAKERGHKEVPL